MILRVIVSVCSVVFVLLGSAVDTVQAAVFGGFGTLSHFFLRARGPRILRSILPVFGDDFWKMLIQRHWIHAHASVHRDAGFLHIFHEKVLAARLKLGHGVPAVGHGTFWCPQQCASWCLTMASLLMVLVRLWRTRQVCSQLRASWCSPMVSSPLLRRAQRRAARTPLMVARAHCPVRFCLPDVGFVGFKDVTTDCEQVLMLALSQKPVSIAITADQSSFQLLKTGVLTTTC